MSIHLNKIIEAKRFSKTCKVHDTFLPLFVFVRTGTRDRRSVIFPSSQCV